MLLLSEQTTLNHAGLNPQSIATVGSLLGDRATIVAKPGGDGGQGAGSATGGSTTLQTGLIYANTTVPGGNTVANAASGIFTSACTVPANMLQLGGVLFFKAWGVYGTAVAPTTLTLKLTALITAYVTTPAFTTVGSLTNAGWTFEAQLHCQSTGAGGTLESQGLAEFSTAATTGLIVNEANTAAIAYNTTANRTFSLSVAWGTANAANTITLRNFSVRYEQAQTFS